MRLTVVAAAVLFVLFVPACGDDEVGLDAAEDSLDAAGGDTTEPDVDVNVDVDVDVDVDAEPDTVADVAPDVTQDVTQDVAQDTAGDVTPTPFEWPVPLSAVNVTPHESWRSTVQFGCEDYACDPFLSARVFWDRPESRWVKFVVPMAAPDQVYFQDSAPYPFHGPFVSERLDPWQGLEQGAIDFISLYEQGQELILGAVVFAPDMLPYELGVQLVRQDAYHPDMVIRVLDSVRDSLTTTATIGGSGDVEIFYFPTFEQQGAARMWADYLSDAGYPVSDAARWQHTDQCYTVGWGHGLLKKVAAADIEAAYGTALLGPDDILLTDGVPAEIPHLRGIITTSPASLNSHVAILAAAYEVPFVYLASEEQVARAEAMVGKHVALRADGSVWSGPCARLEITADPFDPEIADALDGLKPEPVVDYPPRVSAGAMGVDVDTLDPEYLDRFGGKAANYGFLRTTIGANVRPGVAFSFDAWDAFMGQPVPAGAPGASGESTLSAWISSRLTGLSWPQDIATLRQRLDEIRDTIKSAPIPQGLLTSVLTALSNFDANRKIRFRSSTNVEDGANFTGAGLYDSYSGCLADDQDADADGPSLCDATKAKERGVFRAIRKVYASFYNDNAYLERLRRGVIEAEVAMGILAHHSFPDPLELANGVATHRYSGANSQTATMVTQLGAVSVANPDTDAIAEVMQVGIYGFGIYADLLTASSLVPLGGRVMEDPADYEAFAGLFKTVAEAWAARDGVKGSFFLDFEYKKIEPIGSGELPHVVKQVRPLPTPAGPGDGPKFAIGGDSAWCTLQGESGDDAFAVHRLRSIWHLAQPSMALPAQEAQWTSSLYTHMSVTHRDGDGGVAVTTEGVPPNLTGYGFDSDFDYNSRTLIDAFTVDLGTIAIETRPYEGYWGPLPLVYAQEMPRFVKGQWSTPQPGIGWDGVNARSEDGVRLIPCADLEPRPDDLPVSRTWTWTPDGLGDPADAAAITFELRFFWPAPPTGITAGYTAPLQRWTSLTITGLIDTPITLTAPWAMSYRPGHHNFSEEVVIDPSLDPALTAAQQTALDALDIKLIHVQGSGGYNQTDVSSPATVHLVGAANTLRKFKARQALPQE